MTPPLDLVECSHCRGCFTAEATDELFHHMTGRCRGEASNATDADPFHDPAPGRNPF